MDCVVDKDDVLIAVHKIHNRLGGVAEKTKTKKKTLTNRVLDAICKKKIKIKTQLSLFLSLIQSISPSPHMHICLQSKEEVSEQPLVHRGPLEFWDAEHSGTWAGTELTPLFISHGHASETQIDPQVPL